ncbi:hypothetical protein PGTUg99_032716 [Puccinia graminis f. sp. tritici]|uniref:Uncharacterized protein n=1 Tax=Puccinia graminis f. sp. tritici TaxID=56615 RepID=A0A5B0LUQ9_PUCGR|nr:hypothetical protein PGTUg99_032716 [Puccinia graminis f. sp. tritici]
MRPPASSDQRQHPEIPAAKSSSRSHGFSDAHHVLLPSNQPHPPEDPSTVQRIRVFHMASCAD